MPFAKGRFSKAISDRSGMEFPYNEMIKEWNGMLVHKSEYEAKHPQLEARHYTGDGHGLKDARPAREENEVSRMLDPNPFETIAASSGIINVFEKSHGRSTSDTVRFRGPVWTSSDSDAHQNPTDFDGIIGSSGAFWSRMGSAGAFCGIMVSSVVLWHPMGIIGYAGSSEVLLDLMWSYGGIRWSFCSLMMVLWGLVLEQLLLCLVLM